MKKIFSLFILSLIVAMAWADVTFKASDLFTSSTSATSGTYTFTSAKADGSTDPVYNSSGLDLRLYAGNTFTIATTGDNMTQVVFTLSTKGKQRLAEITSDQGSIATQAVGDESVTWTGDSKSVTFTVGPNATYGSDGPSKAGQFDFTEFTITAGDGQAVTLEAPVITPATCSFMHFMEVTISHSDPEAAIYYTLDGSQPTAESTHYFAPLDITQTCFLKAIAVKGEDVSPVATERYNRRPEVTTTSVGFPYEEDFLTSIGDCYVDDVVLPLSANTIWNQDTRYGMKASAYLSNTIYPSESWLLTPWIALVGEREPKLFLHHARNKFQTVSNIADETTLWVREYPYGEWTQLELPVPESQSWTYVTDEIDLTPYAGMSIQLGFKYVSTETSAGTWEIDNLKVAKADEEALELWQVLYWGDDDEAYNITNELYVAYASSSDKLVYVTDNATEVVQDGETYEWYPSWIAIDCSEQPELFNKLASMNTIKGGSLHGILKELYLNTYFIPTDDVEDADKPLPDLVLYQYQASTNIDALANEIGIITGTYKNGKLCGDNNGNEQAFDLNLDYLTGGSMTEGKDYDVLCVFKYKEEWEDDFAPARAPRKPRTRAHYGEDDSWTNYIIYPISIEESTTAVRDIDTAKAVESVRYVNVAGLMSDKPFDGMNIVVTTYSDGSVKSHKLVK